jgi:hypothetical protein
MSSASTYHQVSSKQASPKKCRGNKMVDYTTRYTANQLFCDEEYHMIWKGTSVRFLFCVRLRLYMQNLSSVAAEAYPGSGGGHPGASHKFTISKIFCKRHAWMLDWHLGCECDNLGCHFKKRFVSRRKLKGLLSDLTKA